MKMRLEYHSSVCTGKQRVFESFRVVGREINRCNHPGLLGSDVFFLDRQKGIGFSCTVF